MSRQRTVTFTGTLTGKGGDAECEGTAVEVTNLNGMVAHARFKVARHWPTLPDGDYLMRLSVGKPEQVKCVNGNITSR